MPYILYVYIKYSSLQSYRYTYISGQVNRIALVANDVTRYHDYASGSHRGASRTNYPPKWHLAIGMLCRF